MVSPLFGACVGAPLCVPVGVPCSAGATVLASVRIRRAVGGREASHGCVRRSVWHRRSTGGWRSRDRLRSGWNRWLWRTRRCVWRRLRGRDWRWLLHRVLRWRRRRGWRGCRRRVWCRHSRSRWRQIRRNWRIRRHRSRGLGGCGGRVSRCGGRRRVRRRGVYRCVRRRVWR